MELSPYSPEAPDALLQQVRRIISRLKGIVPYCGPAAALAPAASGPQQGSLVAMKEDTLFFCPSFPDHISSGRYAVSAD